MGQDVDARAAAQPSAANRLHKRSGLAATELNDIERLDEDTLRARGSAPQISLEAVCRIAHAGQVQLPRPLAVKARVSAPTITMPP